MTCIKGFLKDANVSIRVKTGSFSMPSTPYDKRISVILT